MNTDKKEKNYCAMEKIKLDYICRKRIINPLVVLLLVLLLLPSCKSHKVITSSQRQKPQWVFGFQRGYIIGIGQGKDIYEAQNRAMLNIRERIADMVYSEIISRKQDKTSEFTYDDTYRIISEFTKETISLSGRGVNLHGVSSANATDFYYQLVRERKTQQQEALYAIKYPFSRLEMNQLVNIFHQKQNDLLLQLQQIEERKNDYDNLEELFADVYNLLTIQKGLIPGYRDGVDLVLSDIYSFLNSLYVSVMEEGDDFMKFQLRHKNGAIDFSSRPSVTSDVLHITRFYREENCWIVRYRVPDNLIERGEIPRVNIEVQYGNWKLNHNHTLNTDVSVNIFSPIIMEAVRYSFWGTTIREWNLTLQFVTMGLGQISLQSLILHPVKTTGTTTSRLSPLTLQFPESVVLNRGKTSNVFRQDIPLRKRDFADSGNSMITVSGTLFYTELPTGQRKSLQLNDIKIITNW